MIASYVGENDEFERQMLSGELEVEILNPKAHWRKGAVQEAQVFQHFYTCRTMETEVARREDGREYNGNDTYWNSALTAVFRIMKAWKGIRTAICCSLRNSQELQSH